MPKAKAKNSSALHHGHRARMRERLSKVKNFETFADHEIVEILLYSCYRRINTNEIAHRLVLHFGSLIDVFLATEQELIDSKIIGANPAAKLHTITASIVTGVCGRLDSFDRGSAPRVKPVTYMAEDVEIVTADGSIHWTPPEQPEPKAEKGSGSPKKASHKHKCE